MPLDPEAQAAALAEAGDFSVAAKQFRALITTRPCDAALHEQLAQCLAELGDYEEAGVAAATSTSLAPKWAEGWVTLARIEVNSGNFGRGVQAYNMALPYATSEARPAIEMEKGGAEGLWSQLIARRIGFPDLRIEQIQGDSEGPGSRIWECGLALGEFLAQRQRGWLGGRTVLELGSGTGIAGIAAALAGAAVTLTDTARVLPLLSRNLERNGVAGRAITYDWAAPDDALLDETSFDAVIAADPVYAATQVPEFAAALHGVLKRNLGCRVWLAHKARHANVDAALFAALERGGCKLWAVAASSIEPSVTIYEGVRTEGSLA